MMMTKSQSKAAALQQRKGAGRISCLTAYDYPTARLLDETGVDLLLVGDSLGMVVLGFPDTTHVTMAHMMHHIEAVARGAKNALVVGDLPIHSYDTPADAVSNAKLLVGAGADAVKLEGGVRQADKVKAIVAAGIPVFGHMGMLPQRVLQEGGYKKKGKTEAAFEEILAGCKALEEAGVFATVLESVVAETAQRLTDALQVPTIGIGCGENTCDGEVAVITDLVGGYPWFVPPFAQPQANISAAITQAVQWYVGKE